MQIWKNPVTGDLHFQVHPSAVQELLIDPIPASKKANLSEQELKEAQYPDGARVTDLKEVREICYQLQRPSISPEVCTLYRSSHISWARALGDQGCTS